MTTQIFQIAGSITSVIGGVCFVAALFILYLGKKQARSVSHIVGHTQLRTEDVVGILGQFSDDQMRLKALEHLLQGQARQAEQILEKIKSEIDVTKLVKAHDRGWLKILKTVGIVLFGFGLLLLFAGFQQPLGRSRFTNSVASSNAALVPPPANGISSLSMKVLLADDAVRISLNGVTLHEGGLTVLEIGLSKLIQGTNTLQIDVFNKATRTGGIAFLGGGQKEGWGYSCVLTVNGNSFPYSGSYGNDPPDSQWGKWFEVRHIKLILDNNRTIRVTE